MAKTAQSPHIQLEKSRRHARVITCGSPERAELIAKSLKGAKAIGRNREYHSYLGQRNGQDILVISHGIGCPGAMICFQELAASGAQTIIRVGTGGGLYDGMKVGDLVVATAAVRQEGTTRAMVPGEFPAIADGALTESIFQGLREKKLGVKKGIVVTTDTFYPGLLDNQLKLYSDAGAIAVEMEVSSLFILGTLKDIRTAGVFALDGNPLKWKEGVYDPTGLAMKKALAAAIEVALDTLAKA